MKTLWELCRESQDIGSVGGTKNLPIGLVTDDSAKAGEKSLFVCLRGHRADGASFAHDAYRQGCRAFLCDRALDLPGDAAVILSKNVRRTASEFLCGFFDHPERNMHIVGITGTKGKTTAAWILRELLWEAGQNVAFIGTPGVYVGDAYLPGRNTTPDLFTLIPLLARFAAEGVQTVVCEVSSLALKDGRVSGIPFVAGGFTSMGEDHIGAGAHADFAEYLAAKRSLFTSYRMEFVAYDADTPFASYVSAGVPTRIRCSLSDKGDLCATVRKVGENGTDFLCLGAPYHLSLPGSHNLSDALIAVALAARLSGREVQSFLPSLATVQVPGRFEHVQVGGRRVIIDYAHNPMSFEKIGQTARRITPAGNRVIAVFGSVGGREQERRRGLAHEAECFADLSVLTSDNPDFEHPICVCADLYDGFSDKNRARVVPDREEAIRYAFGESQPGDTLLLLGKGHEQYQLIRGEQIPFSERKVVRMLASSPSAYNA